MCTVIVPTSIAIPFGARSLFFGPIVYRTKVLAVYAQRRLLEACKEWPLYHAFASRATTPKQLTLSICYANVVFTFKFWKPVALQYFGINQFVSLDRRLTWLELLFWLVICILWGLALPSKMSFHHAYAFVQCLMWEVQSIKRLCMDGLWMCPALYLQKLGMSPWAHDWCWLSSVTGWLLVSQDASPMWKLHQIWFVTMTDE